MMADLSELEQKSKRSLSPDFLDLERTICQDDALTYSKRMDRLFAEDEMKNAPAEDVISQVSLNSQQSESSDRKQNPSSTKSITYFSAAAFWKKETESVKVGVILSKLENDELCFLMCDASKRVLRKLPVDDIGLRFSKEQLAVRLDSKTKESEEEESNTTDVIDVKFVDFLTFLRFAITALIRSNTHLCFKLSEGSGDVEIDKNCDIRYNITQHSLDEDGGLKLPDERKGAKTRLSQEKLNDHSVYKRIGGLKKGCHLLIKTSENSVCEVIVDKVRKPVDPVQLTEPETNESSDVQVEVTSVESNLENEPTNEETILPEPVSSTLLPDASSNIVPTPAPRSPGVVGLPQTIPKSPPTLSTASNEDVRDALHRIVGIELDRIEMRLNAKFEKLQENINARLDRQSEILQQVLDKLSSN